MTDNAADASRKAKVCSVSHSSRVVHDLELGVRLIAGVDEVGRASLAGPIVAACVLFDLERLLTGAGTALLEELDDSKRLTPAKRERLAPAILIHAEAVSLVSIPANKIDRIGIQAANIACLELALRSAGGRAEQRLVDGQLPLGPDAPEHELIVHGDGTSATIAAASIIAKVERDRLMKRLADHYPDYGFERHKGFSTEAHRAVVAKLGPSQIHRKRFKAPCYAEFDAGSQRAAA